MPNCVCWVSSLFRSRCAIHWTVSVKYRYIEAGETEDIRWSRESWSFRVLTDLSFSDLLFDLFFARVNTRSRKWLNDIKYFRSESCLNSNCSLLSFTTFEFYQFSSEVDVLSTISWNTKHNLNLLWIVYNLSYKLMKVRVLLKWTTFIIPTKYQLFWRHFRYPLVVVFLFCLKIQITWLIHT